MYGKFKMWMDLRKENMEKNLKFGDVCIYVFFGLFGQI